MNDPGSISHNTSPQQFCAGSPRKSDTIYFVPIREGVALSCKRRLRPRTSIWRSRRLSSAQLTEKHEGHDPSASITSDSSNRPRARPAHTAATRRPVLDRRSTSALAQFSLGGRAHTASDQPTDRVTAFLDAASSSAETFPPPVSYTHLTLPTKA